MTMEASDDDVFRQRRDAIYTPLEVAVEELQDRRRKFAGKTPGRDWLPVELTKVSQGFALLARFIPTPNFEARFLKLLDGSGLTPPEEEDAPHWFWHPAELKAFVQERLARV